MVDDHIHFYYHQSSSLVLQFDILRIRNAMLIIYLNITENPPVQQLGTK